MSTQRKPKPAEPATIPDRLVRAMVAGDTQGGAGSLGAITEAAKWLTEHDDQQVRAVAELIDYLVGQVFEAGL